MCRRVFAYTLSTTCTILFFLHHDIIATNMLLLVARHYGFL
nr:MAG TPA: hypothetical protein [Caudoviricetes sp.]